MKKQLAVVLLLEAMSEFGCLASESNGCFSELSDEPTIKEVMDILISLALTLDVREVLTLENVKQFLAKTILAEKRPSYFQSQNGEPPRLRLFHSEPKKAV